MNSLGVADVTLEAFEAIATALAVNCGSATVQNVVNVTEVGQLYAVSIGPLDSPLGSLAANLEIQIDGQSAQTLTLYTGGTLNAAMNAFASFINSGGDLYLLLPFAARYAASLRVGINISVAGSAVTTYLGVTRGRRY